MQEPFSTSVQMKQSTAADGRLDTSINVDMSRTTRIRLSYQVTLGPACTPQCSMRVR